jgi:hypothetical protein
VFVSTTAEDSAPDSSGIALDWKSVLDRWAVAGQTLLARFNALHQLGALAALDGGSAPALADYDAAVEAYVTRVRRTWHEAREAHGTDATAPDFVARLVDDPASPPSTVLFVGFPGDPAEPDHARFYVDPGLSAFVEVPRAMVLHRRDLPASQAPLGGQYVWLQRDADVLDRLQQALADAARLQQQIWSASANGDDPADTAVSPFPDMGVGGPEPFGAHTSVTPFGDDDDVPLPPGWPTSSNE